MLNEFKEFIMRGNVLDLAIAVIIGAAFGTIVKSLVDEAENVDVREVDQRNGSTLIEVRVAQNDVGKIIGKQGRTIRALRSLARIAGTKKNRRYLLEIVE